MIFFPRVLGAIFVIVLILDGLVFANCSNCDEKGRDTLQLRAKYLEQIDIQKKTQSNRVLTQKSLLDGVSLNSNSAECLVTLNRSGECCLTIGEFNTVAETFIQSMGVAVDDMDSLRMSILSSALKSKIWSTFMEDFSRGLPGGDTLLRKADKTFLLEVQQSALEIGHAKLLKLYSELFNALFKGQFQKTTLIMGSSDSILIEFIHNHIIHQIGPNVTGSELKKIRICGKKLPWLISKNNDLPREIIKVVDTLDVGTLSKPIKTKFGSFLVFTTSVQRIPDITFEQATPILVQLSKEDGIILKQEIPVRSDTSITDVSRDTSLIKIWLFPGFSQLSSIPSSCQESLKIRRQIAFQDTSNYSGLYCSPSDLPTWLLNEFMNEERGAINSPKHPVFLKYGIWFFRWDKKIKSFNSNHAQRIVSKIDRSEKSISRLRKYADKSRVKVDEKRATILANVIQSELESRFTSANKNADFSPNAGRMLLDEFDHWMKRNITVAAK